MVIDMTTEGESSLGAHTEVMLDGLPECAHLHLPGLGGKAMVRPVGLMV